jgi:hypothetical protein
VLAFDIGKSCRNAKIVFTVISSAVEVRHGRHHSILRRRV